MKIQLLTIMVLALAVGCSDANVRGRVTCDGKGVSGVVVSDGVNVTVTGGSGRYRLRSDKENGYVFISVPSGYEVGRRGIIPDFFRPVDTAQVSVADFVLYKTDQSVFNAMPWTRTSRSSAAHSFLISSIR